MNSHLSMRLDTSEVMMQWYQCGCNLLLFCNAYLLIYCPQASADCTNGSRSYAPSDVTITRKAIEPTRVLGRFPHLPLVPIAHVHGEIILKDQVLFGQPTMSLLKSEDIVAQRGLHERHLCLENGSILLAPKHNVQVSVPNLEINVSAGSIVYIRTRENDTAVFNLHDDHMDSVRTVSGDVRRYLPPGRVMLVTDNTYTDFDDANPCPGLHYRTVYKHESKEGITTLTSQFSVVSALLILPALRQMVGSHSHEADKILKTAAAVHTISRDPMSYRDKLEDNERSPELQVTGKLRL